MSKVNRRFFTETFKREAVERVRTSGLSIITVALELGLHETVLRRWAPPWGFNPQPTTSDERHNPVHFFGGRSHFQQPLLAIPKLRRT